MKQQWETSNLFDLSFSLQIRQKLKSSMGNNPEIQEKRVCQINEGIIREPNVMILIKTVKAYLFMVNILLIIVVTFLILDDPPSS